jgi:hypothetical protein
VRRFRGTSSKLHSPSGKGEGKIVSKDVSTRSEEGSGRCRNAFTNETKQNRNPKSTKKVINPNFYIN